MFHLRRTRFAPLAITMSVVLAAAGCSVGSIGSSDDAGGDTTTIRMLVPVSADGQTEVQEAMIKAFTAKNPKIKINLETQPGGTEGDNLTKTKLSTGEMPEVFNYNSGSLMQALSPDTQLVNLSDQPWAKDLDKNFVSTVSTSKGMYGAPLGTTSAGGVLYNKKVYTELGLKVPTSWAEFDANNKKIKAAGKVPVIQTFGTDWTAQLFVLADFANVQAQDPDWADAYTKGQRKYAAQPAVQGWLNQQQTAKAGYYNKDAASAEYDQGATLLASGDGVHWPMLSSALSLIEQNHPDNLDDIGMFALPAQDGADTRLTIWLPNAFYIPKTAEGAKLDAAKKFIAFAMSDEGCAIQNDKGVPAGPYALNSCELPDDVAPVLTDIEKYTEAEKASPAAEFLSPIKGPALPNLTVEVGRGIKTGAAGAKLYDEDVKKQAQQLGLPGW
ncbi:ABC transporter substrate-binding protein [Microlunatus soli]|uniref:Carbohydrate ABC transporter substrate-binding protein, CUT1 family n=1 Tax=Microlunatus soli TaxID=630515 RepID=A0A1H2AL88_9ACTN|nr:ABC transporter substrate-binding protein [Microlunatus soli]SDT46614.1 carbohydrate ABC transporter substrate-binding protein, CUT1 family [Microlunatus soli]